MNNRSDREKPEIKGRLAGQRIRSGPTACLTVNWRLITTRICVSLYRSIAYPGDTVDLINRLELLVAAHAGYEESSTIDIRDEKDSKNINNGAGVHYTPRYMSYQQK